MRYKIGVILFAIYKLTELKVRSRFTNKGNIAKMYKLDLEAAELEKLLNKTFTK